MTLSTEWFRKQDHAFTAAASNGDANFIVGKTDMTLPNPADRDKRQYALFKTQNDVFAYIQNNNDRECFYEIVYGANFQRDTRYNHLHARKARLYFDLEDYTAGSHPDPAWPDRIGAIMRNVGRMIAEIAPAQGFAVDWCIMDSSRPSSKSSTFKNSTHLVARNLYVADNAHTLKSFVELMLLLMSDADTALVQATPRCGSRNQNATIVDFGVYSSNRNMRLLYSKKNAGDEAYMRCCSTEYPYPLLDDAAMAVIDPVAYDCFIMHDMPNDGSCILINQENIKRMAPFKIETVSSASVVTLLHSNNNRAVQFGCNPRSTLEACNLPEQRYNAAKKVERALVKWLHNSSVSRKMNWQEAHIASVLPLEDQSIIFKLEFNRANVPRTCPAGTKHRGGCGRRWMVRVNMESLRLECYCFRTTDLSRKCAQKKWQRIRVRRRSFNGQHIKTPVTLAVA